VILILGLAGLFGAGPLSKGTVSDEQDILYSARKEHGLERLDRIKYATLETTGYISIIPAA
jgi:uncharacterized membrane protein YcaP (DUF421 family)